MDYKSFYNDLSEEYPATWNKEEFERIQSFAGKLRYAATHLPKLASGSGRAVFKIDDQKVLKVAKNKKGLAQNAVESEKFLQQYDIVARTFDSDDRYVKDIGPFWVEMELAKKVTPTRFRQITGVDIKELERYLRYFEYRHAGNRLFAVTIPDELKNKMESNEFVGSLISLNGDYDMESGDQGRLSTYGEVLRDGNPAIVLVDFGLTRNVFNDFYRVR